jgi:hypothetical protein
MPTDLTTVALPLASLLTGGVALFKGGKQAGDFEAHQRDVLRRLDVIEERQAQVVSRHEMESRFTAIDEKLNLLIHLMKNGK